MRAIEPHRDRCVRSGPCEPRCGRWPKGKLVYRQLLCLCSLRPSPRVSLIQLHGACPASSAYSLSLRRHGHSSSIWGAWTAWEPGDRSSGPSSPRGQAPHGTTVSHINLGLRPRPGGFGLAPPSLSLPDAGREAMWHAARWVQVRQAVRRPGKANKLKHATIA